MSKYGRTVIDIPSSASPVADRMHIPADSYSTGFASATVTAAIDSAVTDGRLLVLAFHDFDSGDLTNFETVVDHVISNGYTTARLGDVIG